MSTNFFPILSRLLARLCTLLKRALTLCSMASIGLVAQQWTNSTTELAIDLDQDGMTDAQLVRLDHYVTDFGWLGTYNYLLDSTWELTPSGTNRIYCRLPNSGESLPSSVDSIREDDWVKRLPLMYQSFRFNGEAKPTVLDSTANYVPVGAFFVGLRFAAGDGRHYAWLEAANRKPTSAVRFINSGLAYKPEAPTMVGSKEAVPADRPTFRAFDLDQDQTIDLVVRTRQQVVEGSAGRRVWVDLLASQSIEILQTNVTGAILRMTPRDLIPRRPILPLRWAAGDGTWRPLLSPAEAGAPGAEAGFLEGAQSGDVPLRFAGGVGWLTFVRTLIATNPWSASVIIHPTFDYPSLGEAPFHPSVYSPQDLNFDGRLDDFWPVGEVTRRHFDFDHDGKADMLETRWFSRARKIFSSGSTGSESDDIHLTLPVPGRFLMDLKMELPALFPLGHVFNGAPAGTAWQSDSAFVSHYYRSFGNGFFGDGTISKSSAVGYWVMELEIGGEKRLAWVAASEPAAGMETRGLATSTVADFGIQSSPADPLVVGVNSSARRWIDVIAWNAERRELTVGIASDVWTAPLWPQYRSVEPGGEWKDFEVGNVVSTVLPDMGYGFILRNLPEGAALLRLR